MTHLGRIRRRVKSLRRQFGWSAKTLAVMSGVSEKTVKRIEKDRSGWYDWYNPSLDTLDAIANGLGIRLSQLVSSSPRTLPPV